MVLPAGTRLPPLEYAVLVLSAAGAVAWLLRRESPRVDAATVLGLAPWMATGSVLYVLAQIGAAPAPLRPLFESPTVYVTTFAVAGAVWLAALRAGRAPPPVLAAAGALAFLGATGVAVASGLARDSFAPVPSTVALAVAGALTAVAWVGFRAARPRDAAAVGAAGALAVLGHAVDGVSTAVGVSTLGFGERTPLSRFILEFTAANLPAAPYFGSGWLFVLVKLGLAVGIVALLAEYVRDDPTPGYLLVALVAAVGLGPGVHNLVLFAVRAPV